MRRWHWLGGVVLLGGLGIAEVGEVAADDAPRYHATASVELANITPEVAKLRAREAAYAEILAQASGVAIHKELVIVNGKSASWLQSRISNARVVGGECRYRTEAEPLRIDADCSGAVITYGANAPVVRADLLYPAANADRCQPAADPLRPPPEHYQLRSGERFCLQLRSSEAVWVGVYAQFYGADGEPRLNRLYPSSHQADSAVALLPQQPQIFPPLASEPLPEQSESIERLIILTSRRHELFDPLGEGVGSSAAATAAESRPLAEFDALLQRLDRSQLSIQTLALVVVRD